MTATEASRGFSDLLDAVESGETVRLTRGGHVVAEVRPAAVRTGRELRLALEESGSRLGDQDADDMLRTIDETLSYLRPDDRDPWDDA